MKKRFLNTSDIDVEFRQDYLNISKDTAISSEGVIFKIGDTVGHEGAEEGEVASITGFRIDTESYDIIADTSRGFGRISFMYHPQQNLD